MQKTDNKKRIHNGKKSRDRDYRNEENKKSYRDSLPQHDEKQSEIFDMHFHQMLIYNPYIYMLINF